VHLTIIKQHATSKWHKTNTGKYGVCLLCASMSGIASLGCVLLFINDWQLAMQVNIHHFFHQSFVAAFLPNFLLPKFFTMQYIKAQDNTSALRYKFFLASETICQLC